jgi:hypothetical protein
MSIYDRISAAQMKALQRHLAAVARNDALAGGAAEYVLMGSGEQVLEGVGHQAGVGPLMGPSGAERAALHELFAALVAFDDPLVLVRLAKVYQAAMEGMTVRNPFYKTSWLWPEAHWLDAWLFHWRDSVMSPRGRKPIACAEVVAMVESQALSSELLVRPILQVKRVLRTIEDHQPRAAMLVLVKLPGYGSLLAQHAPMICDHLRTAASPDKIPVLELLHEAMADPEPFRAELLEFSTGDAKTVRAAAETLLVKIKDSVRADLERIASNGDGERRGRAFELLANYYGPAAVAFLRQFEPANLPKTARTGWERALATAASAEPNDAAAPGPKPVETKVPLSAEAREAFRQLVVARNLALAGLRKDRRDITTPDWQEADIQARIQMLETMAQPKPEWPGLFRLQFPGLKDAAIAFAGASGVEPIHVVRLLLLAGNLLPADRLGGYYSFIPPATEILDRLRRRRGFNLLDLAAVMRALGIDHRSIAFSMAEKSGAFLNWPPGAVAPYLLQHVDILESFLRVRPSPHWWYAADGVFRMMEHLLEVPPQLLPRLWDLATGEADGERALATSILNKLPDLDERLIQALRNGKAYTRANVAHWLADRQRREAVPAILAAFRKEKQEATKDALLVALARLGTPIAELVDRVQLLAECQAIAAKGVPSALEWFPFAKLPEVHWDDTGERVDPAILTGLLIRAYKLATPRPSPLLRRYCALWRGRERAAVGQFILDAWIARDVGDSVPGGQVVTMPAPPPTPAPQTPFQPGLLLQLVAKALAQSTPPSTANPSTSAIQEKGILAVAAACCGDGAVTVVSEYLKKWYGYRAAQCRALLGILPWVETPAATQLLLATARRFRTASIREEAETLCLDLAAWKGWSMDQLGDRTIPAAGFDEGPDQELNLGGRSLILTLTPQLAVEVRSSDGKPLKDFPAQAKSDDAELYRQAKQTYSGTRKAVRNVVKQQTDRLYEAMCSERVWPFAELQELLFDHAIAGRLCQRLVWETTTAPPIAFRPLDDRTLTDARDRQVELTADTPVRIAYGPADAADWSRHLADYEVSPLFPQLDRPLYQLSETDDDALRAFEGHSVDFFTLRNLAARFGYQRGALDDGPFFSTYTKRLAGLSLNVELEFSGMEMPGENRPVILTETRFLRDMQPVPLSQVPRVLVSECWHDLKAIAAAGTGYDPNWKDKVPF